jgi:hypothetical protein
MGQMDKGVSGAEVDEGCNRVMKDRAKWIEGENGINRARCQIITGATPNKQLKSQVTYDYRTPT